MYAPGRMSQSDWAKISALGIEGHSWGEKEEIDRTVILTLNDVAAFTGIKFQITCGTQGTHVADSYHYAAGEKLGCALDFMCPGLKRKELPDLYFELIRYPFGGLGAYSQWCLSPDSDPQGGFHVDTRTGYRKALWLKDTGGYVAFSQKNLDAFFI